MAGKIFDVEMTLQELTPQEREEEEKLIPKYMSRFEPKEIDKERIIKEISNEIEAIDEEWGESGVVDRWDELDDMYYGNMQPPVQDQQYNIKRGTAQNKVDIITNKITEAILEPDPMFSVTPRPEDEAKNADEANQFKIDAQAQSDFLDFGMDEEVPIRRPLEMTVRSSVLKNLGWLNIDQKVEVESKKREEVFTGNPKWSIVDQEKGRKIEITKEAAQRIKREKPEVEIEWTNTELDRFLRDYPDDAKKFPGIAKKIARGEKVSLLITYKEIVYNAPFTEYVDNKDLKVRKGIDNYQDVCTTQLVAEREEYTWWELKQLEEKEYFYDIDKLIKDEDNQKDADKNYANEKYEIWKCTFITNVTEGDEDKVKAEYWVSLEEDNKIMVGSKFFDFYAFGSKYVPFITKNVSKGLINQSGVGDTMIDDDVVMNEFTNFLIEGMKIASNITPITDEGSATDMQFLENRFSPGLSMQRTQGEVIDFLQNHIKPPDVSGILAIMQWVQQGVDNKTMVSSILTGQDSPTDPRAPATKTIAQMNASNINIKPYILSIKNSINQVAYMILAIYAQMTEEGRRYRAKPGEVVGKDPFKTITRAQLSAKTNIQTQSMAFAIDKIREKQELVAFYQLIRTEPLFAQDPEQVRVLLKTIAKAWSPLIKNTIDSLLPAKGELQKKMAITAIQATKVYIEQKIAEAKSINPENPKLDFNPQELMARLAEATKFIGTPPSKDEAESIEERQKNQTGGK